MECKLKRLILSSQTEIFSEKRDFFKCRPKFSKGISNGKCAFHLLVPGVLAWIAFDPIFREKFWKWNERISVEISIRDLNLTRPIYYNGRPTGFSK